MSKSKWSLLLCAMALLLQCRSASASLTISLAFADGSTQYQLTPADWGNTIPINVWATVTTPGRISANNHDGLQYLYYDVLSTVPNGGFGTPGGSTAVDGQIGSVALTPFFDATGSQAGSVMNANNDGVLDLGPDSSPNQFNNTQQMVLLAKPRADQPGIWDTDASYTSDVVISPNGYSVSFLIEQLSFQDNTDNGIETDFNPIIPTLGVNYAPANWFEDDPAIPGVGQSVGPEYTKTGPMIAGAGVQIFGNGEAAVPEPASLSLLTIGAAGLLARRRSRRN